MLPLNPYDTLNVCLDPLDAPLDPLDVPLNVALDSHTKLDNIAAHFLK